jgi:CheY-like chemotaxis protein
MLDGLAVLIVEDDFLIALTLADAVEEAGGSVIGPASTTTVALGLLALERVRAAILDVNLADRDIEPVLNECMTVGIPTVVHSATGLSPLLAKLYPQVPVLLKPQVPDSVVLALADVVARGWPDRLAFQ